MRIQIDQSGKIEDTTSDTVLAFCDGKTRSILIGKKEKRGLQEFFRRAHKGKIFVSKTFAILIFLLIKNDLQRIQHISIDLEYPGRDYLIKDYLLREIRQFRSFDKRDIDFIKIGRKAKAHEVAINVFRKRKKPDVIVIKEDIVKFLEKKKTTQAFVE